jgi:hypothetical protein
LFSSRFFILPDLNRRQALRFELAEDLGLVVTVSVPETVWPVAVSAV